MNNNHQNNNNNNDKGGEEREKWKNINDATKVEHRRNSERLMKSCKACYNLYWERKKWLSRDTLHFTHRHSYLNLQTARVGNYTVE